MKRNLFFCILILFTLIIDACKPKGPIVEQTLIVWDQYSGIEESKIIEQLNAEFQKNHPGVTIQREIKTVDELRTGLNTALANDTGPDIVEIPLGRMGMSDLIKKDLLATLDDYARQYKWSDRISESLLDRLSFREDGKRFGEGNLYGISPTANVIGVYYNKKMFAENGWSVPNSFEELEKILSHAMDEGIVPIALGSLEGWNAVQMYNAIQNLFTSREYIDDFVFNRNNLDFDTDENLKATEHFYNWFKLGYFTPDFQEIGYTTSNESFKKGDAAITITGSWLAPELTNDTDQEFGFFLLPGVDDPDALAVGGLDMPFVIRASSEKQDLAAQYLDWMISERAAELWADANIIPAMPLPKRYKQASGTLFGDTLSAWQYIHENDLVGQYLDYATPTMSDRLDFWMRKLLATVSSPEEFVIGINQEYQDWKPFLE